MQRLDEYRILLKREGRMNVDAMIYSSEEIKLEADAVRQLQDAACMPGVVKAFATPDIHVGYGVPIGAVVATDDIIVPAAVGYDINCGMRLMTTPLTVKDVDVKEIAHSISRDIPLGEGMSNLKLSPKELCKILDGGIKAFADIKPDNHRFWLSRNAEEERSDMEKIEENGAMNGDSGSVSDHSIQRGKDQLGTLGGGNHFIEIQEVTDIRDKALAERFGVREGQVVVMIHSGSRALGHQVGGDYMKLAKKISIDSAPNANLCFLPLASKEGQNYIKAMNAAANFAFANRQVMASLVRHNFRHHYGNIPMPTVYDVPHNMAKLEDHDVGKVWVHRKGATRAFPPSRMKNTPFASTGQPVLIPGSMGTASYLLAGREGAEESLYSVNHGAGRVMSRSAALGKRFGGSGGGISDDEFKRAMKDIFYIAGNKRTIKEEAPQAYKDIDIVIEIVAGAGLANVVARMRPIAVLKG